MGPAQPRSLLDEARRSADIDDALDALLGRRRSMAVPTLATPGEVGLMSEGAARPTWTFLTNHGHVLVCVAEDPGIRGRDIAARVGITERAAQSIIADLVAEGYVTRTRVGRRNQYEIHTDVPLRHPVEGGHSVGELLVTLAQLPRTRRRRRTA